MGNNASPYFYDSKFVANTDRVQCDNVLWGNISSFFSRNITNPSVINPIDSLAGIQLTNPARLNTFSGGDSGTGNDITKNIFNRCPNIDGLRILVIHRVQCI